MGRSAGHDEVEEGLENVHDPQRSHLARGGQRTCEAIKDGVDNLAVAQDEDNTAGQSYHQGSRENVFAAGQEQFSNIICTLFVGNAATNTHGKEKSRNLHHIPPIPQHADYQETDGEQQEVEDEEMD